MKLVVFAGITGTGLKKSECIERFILEALRVKGLPLSLSDPASKKYIHYIKFEDELLESTGAPEMSRFLAKTSLYEKIADVEKVFQKIGNQISNINAEYVFLNIHLSYLYQSQFFPPLYEANLKEIINPDTQPEVDILVVTLIDDVFNIWNIMKKREDEFPNTSLRLREILSWRSIEQLQAEAVAKTYTSEGKTVKNHVFSVNHPFKSLYNLIFPKEPICIYLSYPISKTRTDAGKITLINTFRKDMYRLGEELDVVILDPVTIDEFALKFATKEDRNVVLKHENRWNLDIDTIANRQSFPISIPEQEVEEAILDINNNIRPRDFKLIDSALYTVVYRKNFGRVHSTGVMEEITYTISKGKTAYVYNPDEDQDANSPHPFNPDERSFSNYDDYIANIRRSIIQYRERRSKKNLDCSPCGMGLEHKFTSKKINN